MWGPRFVCLDVKLASATERRDDPEFREALTENVERSPRRPLGLNQGTASIVKKGERASGVIYLTNNVTGVRLHSELCDRRRMSLSKLVRENIEFVNVRSLLKQFAGFHLRH